MKFRSTRDSASTPRTSLGEAVFRGLAPDGGLFVPEALPRLRPAELRSLRGRPFVEVAEAVALRLFADTLGEARLRNVVRTASTFEVPVVEPTPQTRVVELFHGPTGSFKDTGARFLSRLLPELDGHRDRPALVIVATSGDTGGAVAHAFRDVPGAKAVVLFPRGRVSTVQREQIISGAAGGRGVRAVEVEGSFDDCQRLVKEALSDPELRRTANPTSANSINVGRLLPQIFHFFHAWAQLEPAPEELVLAVPTGNVGHLVAGVMAQRMGLPAARLVAGVNENDTLERYVREGRLPDRKSRPTLSSAMDVSRPSNLERLTHLFDQDLKRLRAAVDVHACSDEETLTTIAQVARDHHYLLDPHTAVGWSALERSLPPARRTAQRAGVVLATAHPAKFPVVLERATGERPGPPPQWASGPSTATGGEEDPPTVTIPPRMMELRPVLEELVANRGSRV